MTVCNLLVQRGPSKSMSWCKPASSVKYCENVFTGSYSEHKAATDSIGAANITFTGVNAGSEIRVYDAAGAEAAGVESCSADHILEWLIYLSGNTVTIRIVHPTYKIKEFNFVGTVGNQSLPIQQELDKWYSNP